MPRAVHTDQTVITARINLPSGTQTGQIRSNVLLTASAHSHVRLRLTIPRYINISTGRHSI